MSFHGLLDSLLEVPGVLATALFDPDGQPVTHAGDASLVELAGAYQSVWLEKLADSCQNSELGDLGELRFDFETASMYVVRLNEGFFLLTLLTPGAAIWKLKRLLPGVTRSFAEKMS